MGVYKCSHQRRGLGWAHFSRIEMLFTAEQIPTGDIAGTESPGRNQGKYGGRLLKHEVTLI